MRPNKQLLFQFVIASLLAACVTSPSGTVKDAVAADLTEDQAKEHAAAFFNQELAGDTVKNVCGYTTNVIIDQLTADDWTLVEKVDGRWKLTHDCLDGCLFAVISFKLDGSDAKIEHYGWACV